MAGSAPQCGKAVGPPLGLPIRGVGLAQQDGALLCLQMSLRCQVSDVLGVGAPLTYRSGDTDRRDLVPAVVIHGIPNRELSNGREATAACGVHAARSPR